MPPMFALLHVQAEGDEELIKSGGALGDTCHSEAEDDTTVAWKTRYLTVFTRMLQLDFKVLNRR